MDWMSKQVIVIVFIIKLSHGVQIKTKLRRISSTGDDMTCHKEAGNGDYLAIKINDSNTCTGLGWDWGSAPNYETGSTYYEKKHVVEVYEPPVVPEGIVRLPIVFAPGAYIDMYVEFTRNDFTYAAFQILDTLDEMYDVYSGDGEVVMVHLFLRPTQDIARVKTFYGGWVDHVDLRPYPFTVGQTYKITFKALTNDMQVLIDNNEIARYNHYAPPQSARILTYPHIATLLHRVEFVGV